MRAASARREYKRRDLIARAAGPQGRAGLIGLIGQQVAADQVHPRASAGDPEVQTRLDRLDRPAAGVDLIARARGDGQISPVICGREHDRERPLGVTGGQQTAGRTGDIAPRLHDRRGRAV